MPRNCDYLKWTDKQRALMAMEFDLLEKKGNGARYLLDELARKWGMKKEALVYIVRNYKKQTGE